MMVLEKELNDLRRVQADDVAGTLRNGRPRPQLEDQRQLSSTTSTGTGPPPPDISEIEPGGREEMENVSQETVVGDELENTTQSQGLDKTKSNVTGFISTPLGEGGSTSLGDRRSPPPPARASTSSDEGNEDIKAQIANLVLIELSHGLNLTGYWLWSYLRRHKTK